MLLSGTSLALLALVGLAFSRGQRIAPIVRGVAREQKNDYTHIDMHKIANEFELIFPENIAFDEFDKSDATTFDDPDYTVKPVGTLLISNDMNVKVEYTAKNPANGDWIGAYSPAGVDVNTTVPVRWAYANTDPNYSTIGTGELNFNFTNLRADISFWFFSNGTHYPIARQSTAQQSKLLVDFDNYNEPLRPRMVATGDYSVYHLLWSSNNSAAPIMQWGTENDVYPNTVAASTKFIEHDDVCSGFGSRAYGIGWREQGAIHTAVLEGTSALPAGSVIYYQFGDPDQGGMSKEYAFTVPPQPGVVMDRPTTAILFCDLGRGSLDDTETWNAYGRPAINTTMSAAALVQQGEVDVVFHGGDVSYACGYEAVWDFFLNMLSPLASRVLYLTTTGNHESDWFNSPSLYNVSDSGGECGVPAFEHLPMPAPASIEKPYWSYDVGLIHFVGMSTEHNFTTCSEQYTYLEDDLAAVDRSKTPWVIFNGHRAMYVSSNYSAANVSTSDGAVMTQLIEHIEPLLFKYRVNAAFWGHNHVFQRQSALYNSSVVQHSKQTKNSDGESVALYANPQATVQMVIGNAGADFSLNALHPPPEWNEVTMNYYGYSVVKAYNASYLTWDSIDSNTESGMEVMDRVVITQDTVWFGTGQPWSLPETDEFQSMPAPSTPVCTNSDVIPASEESHSEVAIIATCTVLGTMMIVAAIVYYKKAVAVSTVRGTGDALYPAGSVIKNPLIDGSYDEACQDEYSPNP